MKRAWPREVSMENRWRQDINQIDVRGREKEKQEMMLEYRNHTARHTPWNSDSQDLLN